MNKGLIAAIAIILCVAVAVCVILVVNKGNEEEPSKPETSTPAVTVSEDESSAVIASEDEPSVVEQSVEESEVSAEPSEEISIPNFQPTTSEGNGQKPVSGGDASGEEVYLPIVPIGNN